MSNSRSRALIAAFAVGALAALAPAPALAGAPEESNASEAVLEAADPARELEVESSELALDLTASPRPVVEPPKLEIEVPLGESTRAVADFVTEFVTTGVVVNELDEGSPDQRIHRVRGSYKRGALALTWRVSF